MYGIYKQAFQDAWLKAFRDEIKKITCSVHQKETIVWGVSSLVIAGHIQNKLRVDHISGSKDVLAGLCHGKSAKIHSQERQDLKQLGSPNHPRSFTNPLEFHLGVPLPCSVCAWIAHKPKKLPKITGEIPQMFLCIISGQKKNGASITAMPPSRWSE